MFQPVEILDETERHLSHLEQKLKEQVDQTSLLLKKFEAIKNGYKDEIIHFKPKSGTGRSNGLMFTFIGNPYTHHQYWCLNI